MKKYAVQKLLGQHVPITEGGRIRNLRNQARPVAETQECCGGSFIGDQNVLIGICWFCLGLPTVILINCEHTRALRKSLGFGCNTYFYFKLIDCMILD